jgi:RNA polymerase sigma-70 factor (ECF subfamily)
MTTSLEASFFRHEYGRLVAMLSRRVGVHHLEAVEDAVQFALLAAVEVWPRGTVPDNPSAWLYRVAHNQFLGEQRQRSRHHELLAERGPPRPPTDEPQEAFLSGDVRDDLMRMLFVCCDEALPVESQLVLALKTLGGFGVREIAERLFTTEANVYKRLARGRDRLAEKPLDPDLTDEQLVVRLPAVQSVLYVMFTEGYLSSHPDGAIRRDLCDEATRLTAVLAEHRIGATPTTFALRALIHLHGARLSARQDQGGGLLLLEEQDRSHWDQAEIAVGLSWLARASGGTIFSRYHAEAAIAAEHCLAPSFAETRWDRIVECYALLDRIAPSPIYTLNRAIAMGELQGPARGLAELEGLEPPTWLVGSHLWAAVLADLHGRCGHTDLAHRYREAALEAAPSEAVRTLLARRFAHPRRPR